MRLARSWLAEFTPLELAADELSDLLSDLGLEVEEVTTVGDVPSEVVVARVLEVRPHPDADRIRLVDVDPGDGSPLQVCCGANNMAAGDLVALAPVGTVMPDGLEIASRRMRGQVSDGMLCSERELGLGDGHEGILVLDGPTTPGSPLVDVLGVRPDVVVEVDVLPNRPDALSVLGVARDVAARLGTPFDVDGGPSVVLDGPLEGASVALDAPDLCGRFATCVLDDVRVGPSPAWLAARLEAAGMRPINVVVDVTNYVMLELGQPSHAFDLALVPDGHLGVRRARAGERLVTLDGVERTLDLADAVVVDRDDRVLALAGVMGGAETEISGTTTSVLLEVAWWDPPTVAATSARLGLHSEASLRFKRGVDTGIGRRAMDRVAELLVEHAGASVRPGVAEVTGDLPVPATIPLRPERVARTLGRAFPTDEVRSLLEPMGFGVVGDDELVVSVPTWRPDCTVEVDLVEEVGRMYGLSRLPRTLPRITQRGRLTEAQVRRRAIRRTLVGAGLSEAMPLPFLAPGDLERCELPVTGLLLANPLVAEESVLRPSLLPGLVAAVAYNATHRSTEVRLFEIGRVFEVGEGVLTDVGDSSRAGRVLAGERERLGVVLGGRHAGSAVRLLEAVLEAVGIVGPTLVNEPLPGLHPGRSARVRVRDDRTGSLVDVGSVGEIHPVVLERHGIAEAVAWLDLDLSVLLALEVAARRARSVSRYPSADVDLAFVVDDAVPAETVRATVRETGAPLVTSVRLFDVFRSDALGPGRRSLAYTVRFQAPDRTLTDPEVAEVRQRIIEAVESIDGATLRS